jgi:hypothetical protein
VAVLDAGRRNPTFRNALGKEKNMAEQPLPSRAPDVLVTSEIESV